MALKLKYDFANDVSLEAAVGPTLTCTRTTTATVLDYENILRTVQAGEARFTGGRRVENLCLQSEDLSTTWTNNRSTDSSNVAIAPDGTLTADSLNEDGTVGAHFVSQPIAASIGKKYTLSFHAKASNRNWIFMQAYGQGTFDAYFDLSTGSLGAVRVGTTAAIEDAGNGWYRCSITYVAETVIGANVLLASANADGSFSYTGLTQESVLLWGAQMENVTGQADATPSEYVPTTTAAVYKWYSTAKNGAAMTSNPTGLLIEEARTNLFTYSESFDNAIWLQSGLASVDADVAVAPDGTTTMDRINVTSADAPHWATYNNVATVSDITYTFSTYVKDDGAGFVTLSFVEAGENFIAATFDLSDGTTTKTDVGLTSGTLLDSGSEDVGNGVWRVWISGSTNGVGTSYGYIAVSEAGTFTATDVSVNSYLATAGSDLLVWGAQLEVGSFPTSYIPTVASTVTRNKDAVWSLDVSWYNQSEGSFYASGKVAATATGASGVLVEVNDNSSSDRWLMYTAAADAKARFDVVSSAGANSSLISTGNIITAGTLFRMASGVKVNDAEFYVDGGRIATGDKTVAMPVGISVLNVGADVSETSQINGHIAEIRYYDERLDNAILTDMSNGIFPSSLIERRRRIHKRRQMMKRLPRGRMY